MDLNRFELENLGKTAAQAYIHGGAKLNDTIAKLARDNDLSRHQIARVAESANILVNGALVSQARENGRDPRVTFPLADASAINPHPEVDKAAELRKTAEVAELFRVRGPLDRPRIVDGVFGKLAADPMAGYAVSRDHMAMAADFVKNAADAEARAPTTTAATLSLVCQTLDHLRQTALTDHNLAKEAADGAEYGLRAEINDQLLSGLAPATARSVIKAAGLDATTAKYVEGLVTKIASNLRLREGHSAFGAGAVVNAGHPLITKSAAIMSTVARVADTRRGLDKLATAHQLARVHYQRAVREGR